METLKFLLQSKKADANAPHDVVSTAVEWMATQFNNAEIPHQFAHAGSGFGSYGHFQIESHVREMPITLHLKIAEIHGVPYGFAEVRLRDKHESILFPFFGEIGSEEGRITILHYIADFVLSTTPS